MKKLFSFLVLASCFLAAFSQSKVVLTGKIGPYKVEMSLDRTHGAEMPIGGRYNYAGKKAHLDLEGSLYPGGILFLEESWEGEVTGSFFLEPDGETKFSGTWIGGGKSHPVTLFITSGNVWGLEERVEVETVTNNIAGTYGRTNYFISDFFHTEENPQMEIGFNGGDAQVFQRGKDSIEVQFEFVCGPTYHLAYFEGVAAKVGDRKYVYNAPMYEGEEPCHLIFEFKDKVLIISQESSGMDCGFGARAYAGGDYPKVSDVPQRQEY